MSFNPKNLLDNVTETKNEIARTLLRILPTGKPPTVPERAHQDAIDGHTELLGRSGEMIRRELLPLAILASNYVDQARRAHADLEVLLDVILPVLKSEQLREVTKDDSSVAIKVEDDNDLSRSFESPDTATGDPKDRKTSEGSMVAKEGEAATSKEELQLGEAQRSSTQLPGICVTLLGGYECHCDECDPRFKREIETKMIRKIYKDNSATISAEAKDRITREVIVRHQERIEKEVLAEPEVAKREEVQGRLTIYEEEMRIKKFDEVAKEWEARLASDYYIKVEVDVKENMRKQMGF